MSTLARPSSQYGYQHDAAEWLAQRNAGLLGMSPGLGKSRVAILALQALHAKRIVVVCPLTLLSVWHQEIKRWWPEALRWQVDDQPFSEPPFWPPVLYCVTYEYLRNYGLPYPKPDVLIFDESVLLKNRQALRTKATGAARKQAKVCWMLSGSPTTRFHDDLWSQLRILDRHFAGNPGSGYWEFRHRYCLSRKTIWGEQIVANRPHAEEDLRRDLRDYFYPYSYTDLAREFPDQAIPEWEFETRDVALPEDWWKTYQEMRQKFVANLPSGERVLAPNTLAQLIRLLQLATSPDLLSQGPIRTIDGKLKATVDVLECLPLPCLVWTAFVDTAQTLSSVLKAPLLTGRTGVAQRSQIRDAFQAGDTPVLVAHPGVGRFGITLNKARSAIYVERTYDGDAHLQSLHRIRRIGTVEPPRVVYLLATGPKGEHTVDHVIDKVLSYRKLGTERLTTRLLREALDGSQT